eukprot:Nitzschia sp. Nitz4//scaffold345_size17508//2057//2680//NITZ4_008822-RA/size17508-processed-gene-0.9-mRNA-1//1//CDS//3329548625//9260//frame0
MSSVQETQSSKTPSYTRTDSLRLRNNLFLKLGVDASSSGPRIELPKPRQVGSVLGHAREVTEPLKGDENDEEVEKPDGISWDFSALFGSSKRSGEESASDSETEGPLPSLSSSINSTDTKDLSPTTRKLTFNEEVKVCLIPKKEEYSKRIRDFLWTNPEDMALNAHRNTIEFASENWDWRNAMEDDNMYRCLATNELIHPVHIEQNL